MKQFYLYQEKNDFEVWEAIKNSNENAFSLIFQHYYNFLYNYGLNITSDKDMVKDSIQDLFINIWKSRRKLGEVSSIKFYLLISYKHLLFKKLKKKKRNNEQIQDFSSGKTPVEISVETKMINQQNNTEQINKINHNLSLLSKRQKEAIYLRFYKGFEYQEISSIMSLNYQSVRNLIHEGIKKIKNNLNNNSSKTSNP
ncbi:sigma-70 family RNA polymerase sigma factor [Candidatus Peregrinibacteria bacterium]|nr:sigma-70 family RNA polymerase sigma factor [Candidatus Peregrinibacteria bacterium]